MREFKRRCSAYVVISMCHMLDILWRSLCVLALFANAIILSICTPEVFFSPYQSLLRFG
jgi:hypothetical protein